MTTRQPCRIGALAEWLAKHAGGRNSIDNHGGFQLINPDW